MQVLVLIGTMVGVTPEDLEMAHKLVSTSPGYLSKWTKLELTSAAVALRFFIRELPGGPKLLRRAADLANSAPGGEAERMDHAAKAIKRQEGVDASLYRLQEEEDPAATSTQAPGAAGPGPGAPDASLIARRGNGHAEVDDEGDVSYSQIPSAQGGAGGAARDEGTSGHRSDGTSSSNNDTPDGKVSDHSSCSTHSHAAPPKQLAKAGVVGGGLVDRGADGSGVAGVGGVGDVDAVKQGAKGGRKRNHATDKKTSKSAGVAATATAAPGWRPRVCNQVWKGRSCNNMSNGCRFAHPTPCANNRCKSGPATGCKAFHPRVSKGDLTRRGNGKGSVRRDDAAPKGNNGKSHQPSAKRNRASNSNNSNTRSRSSDLRLGERVELMERQLGLREEMGRKLSYRDVAARGLTTPSSSFNSNNGHTNGSRPDGMGPGGFGLAQPSPDMLGAVVAAVMAVLAGKGQRS